MAVVADVPRMPAVVDLPVVADLAVVADVPVVAETPAAAAVPEMPEASQCLIYSSSEITYGVISFRLAGAYSSYIVVSFCLVYDSNNLSKIEILFSIILIISSA